ncbi:MAG: SAM-dependent methyltransferase [Treponema sp.]|nr:SAM-dependent methyltransferase [Treponema sp.]
MSTKITPLNGIAFLSFPEQIELLRSELRGHFNFTKTPNQVYGELLYFETSDFFCGNKAENQNEQTSASAVELPYWARTAMLEPFILKFDSIGEAAGELKKIQRNWAPYQFTCFRRAELIQEKLPYINLKPRKFPLTIPQSPIGLYTLIDEHTLIASAKTSSFLPAGTLNFVEDHENPPSRAYLKIQESLTMANLFFGVDLPGENSRCFEAGACPGGWTWVLVNLGSKVFAVDRAELAPELMKNPLVTFQAHDAFTLKPEEIGDVDWIFSDVICYPERLLEWIKMWLATGRIKNMICTIKMQGEINWPLISEFAAIPDSKIVHLNYNKHELTWIHCEK